MYASFYSDVLASITVSPNLDVFVLYGNYKGAFKTLGFKIHYKYLRGIPLVFPSLASVESYITVSNQYIYVRNNANVTNAKHGFYLIIDGIPSVHS